MELPDREKVLSALAYCYKLDLEERTGREVIVTWENIHAGTASTSSTAWSGTEVDAQSTRR